MKYYDNYGGVHDRLFDALTTNLGEGAKKFIQPKEPELSELDENDITISDSEVVSSKTNTESTECEVKPSPADEIINADPIIIAADESKIKLQSMLNNSITNGPINSINGSTNTNIIAQG